MRLDAMAAPMMTIDWFTVRFGMNRSAVRMRVRMAMSSRGVGSG